MGVAQALALERFLEGKALAKKAGVTLLTGSGARLLPAAELLVSTGFRLVLAEMGLAPRGGRFVPDAAWVRLQRTAQTQGSTLLLFSPYRMSGLAAEAVVSAGFPRPIWRGSGRAPRLLAGISSRVTLEKYGRETPNRSASMDLSVAEARC